MARAIVSIGVKYAVYPPRSVVEELGLRERERLVLTVKGESIVLRRLPDLFAEARRATKRLRPTPEEFERAGVEAQEGCFRRGFWRVGLRLPGAQPSRGEKVWAYYSPVQPPGGTHGASEGAGRGRLRLRAQGYGLYGPRELEKEAACLKRTST